jgi:hypothetical protein
VILEAVENEHFVCFCLGELERVYTLLSDSRTDFVQSHHLFLTIIFAWLLDHMLFVIKIDNTKVEKIRFCSIVFIMKIK